MSEPCPKCGADDGVCTPEEGCFLDAIDPLVVPDEVLDSKSKPITVGDYVRVLAHENSIVPGHISEGYTAFVKAIKISNGRVFVALTDAKTMAYRPALPEWIKVIKNKTGRVAGEHPVQAKHRRIQRQRRT